MPNYRRWRQSGGSYFFTVNLADRQQSLLTDHIQHLRETFAAVQRRHPFRIDAIVVLPEHLHCIWTLPADDTDYSTRWRLIKSRFCRIIAPTEPRSTSRFHKNERGIWQRRFWEHLLCDEDDFNHHVDYIHYNPVKHSYAKRPADWPHSSIHRYISEGILPPDWGTSGLTTPLNLE